MAPRVCRPASENSSLHESSLRSLPLPTHAASEVSSASHCIAKPNSRQRKAPIIRIVRIFAPKLINADVADFRRLVQELTGNNPNDLAEAQVASHHDPPQQLELKRQKKKETILPHSAQFEKDQSDPFLQHDHILSQQAQSDPNHAGFVITNANYFAANQAAMEERDGYIPEFNQSELALTSDEGFSYFPCANHDYDDNYNYDSPCSLDTSSTRGDSHTSCYERGNDASVFGDELDIMRAFNSSYPSMSLDDQHLPQAFMSAIDSKLELSLLNPTW